MAVAYDWGAIGAILTCDAFNQTFEKSIRGIPVCTGGAHLHLRVFRTGLFLESEIGGSWTGAGYTTHNSGEIDAGSALHLELN